MSGVLTVVEGESDLGFAQALLRAGGAEPGLALIQHGHGMLDRRLRDHWNRTSNHADMLILRDLDPPRGPDACAPGLVNDLTGGVIHAPALCLRIAEREIEAWAMADRDACSDYFGIRAARLPPNPDDVEQPKECFIDLCRKSSRRAIREGMPPRAGSGISIGPEYVLRLRAYSDIWRPEVAAQNSASLCRSLTTVKRFVSEQVWAC